MLIVKLSSKSRGHSALASAVVMLSFRYEYAAAIMLLNMKQNVIYKSCLLRLCLYYSGSSFDA